MRVEVYWNVRTKVFAVRQDGRVIGHATKLLIRDSSFVVRQAGRRRALETGHKTVHAFVRGELAAIRWTETHWGRVDDWTRGDDAYARVARKRLGVPVRYNPKLHETFVDLDWRNGQILGPRREVPMAYLRKFDDHPEILAFDPCDMTAEESAAATV